MKQLLLTVIAALTIIGCSKFEDEIAISAIENPIEHVIVDDNPFNEDLRINDSLSKENPISTRKSSYDYLGNFPLLAFADKDNGSGWTTPWVIQEWLNGYGLHYNNNSNSNNLKKSEWFREKLFIFGKGVDSCGNERDGYGIIIDDETERFTLVLNPCRLDHVRGENLANDFDASYEEININSWSSYDRALWGKTFDKEEFESVFLEVHFGANYHYWSDTMTDFYLYLNSFDDNPIYGEWVLKKPGYVGSYSRELSHPDHIPGSEPVWYDITASYGSNNGPYLTGIVSVDDGIGYTNRLPDDFYFNDYNSIEETFEAFMAAYHLFASPKFN